MLSLIEKSQRLDDASYIARRYSLALCAYREGRSETLWGKKLICQVVENRVQSSRWPDDYISVILQPFQFSSFNKNDANNRVFPPTHYDSTPNMRAWIECWEVAGDVLDDPEDFAKGANHYFADWIAKPSWAKNMTFITKVGRHEFYKD